MRISPRGTTRRGFLSSGAKVGAAVALGGLAAGTAASPAAADTLSDSDLAWARVAVAGELLAIAFYKQLLKAKLVQGTNEQKAIKGALFNEIEHHGAVSEILTGAGQVPALPEDFDYTFPKNAFKTLGAAAKLGLTLETAFLGIYLGGVDRLESSGLKTTFARIGASEAEHLAVFSTVFLRKPAGLSFPVPLDIDAASAALDNYVS